MPSRSRALGGGRLDADSPLLGGPLSGGAGAEEAAPAAPGYDAHADDLAAPRPDRDRVELEELGELRPEAAG